MLCQLLNDRIKLLYDSGADISIVANEVFQKALDKIPPHLRPKRVKIKLKAKSANGKKIMILGCYLTPITIHGKRIIDLIFIGLLRSSGLLGIDIINHLNLSYDEKSKSTYLGQPIQQESAVLSSEVFVKARSAIKVPIHTKYDGTQVYTSNFDIPSLNVQLADVEVVVKADKGKANVYVCNISNEDLRLPQGRRVGDLEKVTLDELMPWNMNQELNIAEVRVDETTPINNESAPEKVIKLSQERKCKI